MEINQEVNQTKNKKNINGFLTIGIFLSILLLSFEGYVIYTMTFKDKSTDQQSEQILNGFEFDRNSKHQEPTQENSVRIQTPSGVKVDENGFAQVPIKNSSSLPVYAIVMYNEKEIYKSSVALEPEQTALATIEFGNELPTDEYTVKLQPEQAGSIGIAVKGTLLTD